MRNQVTENVYNISRYLTENSYYTLNMSMDFITNLLGRTITDNLRPIIKAEPTTENSRQFAVHTALSKLPEQPPIRSDKPIQQAAMFDSVPLSHPKEVTSTGEMPETVTKEVEREIVKTVEKTVTAVQEQAQKAEQHQQVEAQKQAEQPQQSNSRPERIEAAKLQDPAQDKASAPPKNTTSETNSIKNDDTQSVDIPNREAVTPQSPEPHAPLNLVQQQSSEQSAHQSESENKKTEQNVRQQPRDDSKPSKTTQLSSITESSAQHSEDTATDTIDVDRTPLQAPPIYRPEPLIQRAEQHSEAQITSDAKTAPQSTTQQAITQQPSVSPEIRRQSATEQAKSEQQTTTPTTSDSRQIEVGRQSSISPTPQEQSPDSTEIKVQSNDTIPYTAERISGEQPTQSLEEPQPFTPQPLTQLAPQTVIQPSDSVTSSSNITNSTTNATVQSSSVTANIEASQNYTSTQNRDDSTVPTDTKYTAETIARDEIPQQPLPQPPVHVPQPLTQRTESSVAKVGEVGTKAEHSEIRTADPQVKSTSNNVEQSSTVETTSKPDTATTTDRSTPTQTVKSDTAEEYKISSAVKYTADSEATESIPTLAPPPEYPTQPLVQRVTPQMSDSDSATTTATATTAPTTTQSKTPPGTPQAIQHPQTVHTAERSEQERIAQSATQPTDGTVKASAPIHTPVSLTQRATQPDSGAEQATSQPTERTAPSVSTVATANRTTTPSPTLSSESGRNDVINSNSDSNSNSNNNTITSSTTILSDPPQHTPVPLVPLTQQNSTAPQAQTETSEPTTTRANGNEQSSTVSPYKASTTAPQTATSQASMASHTLTTSHTSLTMTHPMADIRTTKSESILSSTANNRTVTATQSMTQPSTTVGPQPLSLTHTQNQSHNQAQNRATPQSESVRTTATVAPQPPTPITPMQLVPSAPESTASEPLTPTPVPSLSAIHKMLRSGGRRIPVKASQIPEIEMIERSEHNITERNATVTRRAINAPVIKQIAPPTPSPLSQVNVQQIVDQVYKEISKKLESERIRRGLF